MQKKTLVLVSRIGAESKDLYIDAADSLIASLRECSGRSILSNVGDTPDEPISWMEEKLKSCNRIVLVFTPLGKRNYELKNDKDPFTIGVNWLLEERKRKFLHLTRSHKFFAIYFDTSIRFCVPEALLTKEIKFMQLPQKLGWFYGNLAQMQLQDVDESHVNTIKNKLSLINDYISAV